MSYLLIASLIYSPYLGLAFGLMYILGKLREIHVWKTVSSPIAAGFAVLALWAGLTAFLEEKWISFLASAVLWMYAGMVLWIQNGSFKASDALKYGHAMIVLGLGSAGIGILQHFGVIVPEKNWFHLMFGLSGPIPDPEQRMTATFGNANLAGAWFAALTVLSVFYLQRAVSLAQKGFYFFCAVTYAGTLMLTGSRGAICGLAAGLLVYGMYLCRRSPWKLCGVWALFILFALGMPEFLPRFEVLHGSLADRWLIWQMSLNLFFDHLIQGIGLAGMYFVDPALTGYHRYAHAHNTLLAVFVELGMVGGLVFLWMQWVIVKHLLRLWRIHHPFVPFFLALFTLFAVHGMVDFTLLTPQVGILYVIIVGLLEKSVQEENEEQVASSSVPAYWKGTRKPKRPAWTDM